MSESNPEIGNLTKTLAIKTLQNLPSQKDAKVDGALLLTDKFTQNQKMSFLNPTNAGADALLSIADFVVEGISQLEVIDYSPSGSAADGQIMWLPLEKVPLLKSISTSASDYDSLPLYNPGETKISHANLVSIQTTADTKTTMFIQALGNQQIVAKSKRASLFLRSGVIDASSDQVLLLSRDVTAVVAGDFVFFENRKSFQKLVNLLEELKEKAEETLRSVSSELRIVGFESLLAAVRNNPVMIGKMESIRIKMETIPAYRDALKMPKILKFVRDHPEYEIELSDDSEEASLVFQKDFQNQFKILKLLDDDYLKSELTAMEYESNSKSAPLTV